MSDLPAGRQYREYRDGLFNDAYKKHGENGAICVADLPTPERPKHCDAWGSWVYDAELMTLTFKYNYEIDLERCSTPAQMLNWIFQLNGKGFTTATDIGDLVAAFDDILYPQSTLCSFGQAKVLDVKNYLQGTKA